MKVCLEGVCLEGSLPQRNVSREVCFWRGFRGGRFEGALPRWRSSSREVNFNGRQLRCEVSLAGGLSR